MNRLLPVAARLVLLLAGLPAWAQTQTPTPAKTYDQLLEVAAGQLKQKDYCAATATFGQAFSDSTKAGPFDLYAGAGAAANCAGQARQALRWLARLPRLATVPITARDVDNMAQDASLASLHDFPQWSSFLADMRKLAARQATEARRAAAEWQAAARRRALSASATKGRFGAAPPGLALYYREVDTVRVPYLVYVPKTYRPNRPTALLVYLHGGIASITQFQAADPRVAEEPIFAAADSLNSLVLYPFGRQSFGWLAQRAALENVRQLVEQVKACYQVDARRVYLGGLSNGGTAAFWYACESPAGFAGFFALSAAPTSALGPLHFGRLRGAPLFSLNAEDDQVFAYKDVRAIYEQHRAQARQWHFSARPTGGHGFLYGPDGPETLRKILAQLMAPARQ